MPTYAIEFGALGNSRPVPPLTIQTDDINDLHRTVAKHAIPYLTPVLAEMGHPQAADCFFRTNDDRTLGEFVWLDLAAGRGARFCPARITAV